MHSEKEEKKTHAHYLLWRTSMVQ